MIVSGVRTALFPIAMFIIIQLRYFHASDFRLFTMETHNDALVGMARTENVQCERQQTQTCDTSR